MPHSANMHTNEEVNFMTEQITRLDIGHAIVTSASVGFAVGGFIIGLAMIGFYENQKNPTIVNQWQMEGGNARIEKKLAERFVFVKSVNNPVTNTSLDRYSVSDYTEASLLVKGIDDQVLEEATSLVRRFCAVQKTFDIEWPNEQKERLLFVDDKSCLKDIR